MVVERFDVALTNTLGKEMVQNHNNRRTLSEVVPKSYQVHFLL